MALLLVTAQRDWRFGRGWVGQKEAARCKECKGLPTRVESEETGRRERPGRVWERPAQEVSEMLRGMGGSGGRRCQLEGPDHLSRSTSEFPRGSQICLSHSW